MIAHPITPDSVAAARKPVLSTLEECRAAVEAKPLCHPLLMADQSSFLQAWVRKTAPGVRS